MFTQILNDLKTNLENLKTNLKINLENLKTNLENLKTYIIYLSVKMNRPIYEWTIEDAIYHNELGILKFLVTQNYEKIESRHIISAREYDHKEIEQYLIENFF